MRHVVLRISNYMASSIFNLCVCVCACVCLLLLISWLLTYRWLEFMTHWVPWHEFDVTSNTKRRNFVENVIINRNEMKQGMRFPECVSKFVFLIRISLLMRLLLLLLCCLFWWRCLSMNLFVKCCMICCMLCFHFLMNGFVWACMCVCVYVCLREWVCKWTFQCAVRPSRPGCHEMFNLRNGCCLCFPGCKIEEEVTTSIQSVVSSRLSLTQCIPSSSSVHVNAHSDAPIFAVIH